MLQTVREFQCSYYVLSYGKLHANYICVCKIEECHRSTKKTSSGMACIDMGGRDSRICTDPRKQTKQVICTHLACFKSRMQPGQV